MNSIDSFQNDWPNGRSKLSIRKPGNKDNLNPLVLEQCRLHWPYLILIICQTCLKPSADQQKSEPMGLKHPIKSLVTRTFILAFKCERLIFARIQKSKYCNRRAEDVWAFNLEQSKSLMTSTTFEKSWEPNYPKWDIRFVKLGSPQVPDHHQHSLFQVAA